MRISKTNSVAVVGCQGIDRYNAYSLVKNRAIGRVLFAGAGSEELAGETIRLLRATASGDGGKIEVGGVRDAAGVDIAIIAPQDDEIDDAGEDRLERVAHYVRGRTRELVEAGFDGILLIAVEPIDVMSYLAWRSSGFDHHRVIGIASGATAETQTITGSATWCSGNRPDVEFLDNCDPMCPMFGQAASNALNGRLEYSGNRISGLATCVTRVCEAIFRDEREVFPVSTLANGEYNVSGVYIDLPVLLGRVGVTRTLELPITAVAQRRMQRYAEELRNVIDKLTPLANAAAAAAGFMRNNHPGRNKENESIQ